MKHLPADWVKDYIQALDEGELDSALRTLDQAWETTQGLSGSWSTVWVATARQGFLEGTRRLLNWGVPIPKLSGRTLRERVLLAVVEQRSSASQAFEKSDGTRFRGWHGKDPQALLECYFGPSSPALSLAEAKTLYNSDQTDWLEKAMKSPGVRPWGGSLACRFAREVLADLVFNHVYVLERNPSRKAVWDALRANPPGGMGTLSSRNGFLQDFVESARVYVDQRRQMSAQTGAPLIPFEQGLEFLQSLGLERKAIADAFLKNQGECLAIVSLRLNAPLGFEWDLERGLNWDASAKLLGALPNNTGKGFAEGSSLFSVISARLRVENDPRAEQWWQLCEQHLAPLPAFQQRLARHREDPNHWPPQAWSRWQALVKQVRLDTMLPSDEESVLAPAPRVRF